MKSAKVFAPATIANIGPGFDIFGVALDEPGDIVLAVESEANIGVKLVDIINNPGLPYGPENVVEAVGAKVLEASGESKGIELILQKNMKIGTGMGSSASSAVAAALAVNSVLDKPFRRNDPVIIDAVVYGEAVATKSQRGHPDNVLPSLLGGFVFIYDSNNFAHRRYEIKDSPYLVVVAPDLRVDTGDARRALKDAPYDISKLVSLSQRFVIWGRLDESFMPTEKAVKSGGSVSVVEEYLNGALMVAEGLQEGDFEKVGKGMMMDGIVTPVREKFIPGYDRAKSEALNAGAYGFTISGSGPSVAMVVRDDALSACKVQGAVINAFKAEGISAVGYISKVNNNGARLL
ncbi:homoserine kinase [Candidatus Woesearchaeota archaeon]|nr:homoserine kinase [Candidatus Woesearchaeota archaeon]